MGFVWGLISLCGGAFAKLFTIETLKFIATRALLLSLFTLVLPVVLYNLIIYVVQEMLTYTSTMVDGQSLTSVVVQLSGIGAYLATCLQVPASIALIMSAVSFRWILSFIKR